MMYDPEEKIKRLTILQRLLCNKGITALTTGLITLTPTVGLSATTRLLMWSQGSGTENLHVSKLVGWAMPTVRPYSRVAVGLVERKRYPTRFGAVGFRSSNQPTTLPVELAQALSRDSSSVRGRLDSNSFGLENGKYGNIHPFEGRAGE